MPDLDLDAEWPPVCLRCRRTLRSAEQLHDLSREALQALERMRLALPTALVHGIREIERETRCRAGRCVREAA